MKLKRQIISIFVLAVMAISVGVGFIKVKEVSALDLSVNESIENLLTKFFEMELSSDEEDCSNLVLDSKLAEIYNLKFKNLRESNSHKENKSLKINIENIDEIENNKFIVNFKVIKEFTCEGSPDKAYAEDQYISEIIKKDNNFYINKLLDYFDYVQTLDENLPVNNKSRSQNTMPSDILSDNKYNSIIDNQKSSLEEFDKNREEINYKLKTQQEDKTNYKKVNARYGGYDWRSAVNYAKKYAYSYNPAFTVYSADCQNFVSQCVYAGGVPMNQYWHHYTSKYYTYDVTSSWRLVQDFYTYIKNNGYTWGDDYYHSWRLGDVVQMYNSEINQYTHSVILTGTYYDGTPRYSAHTRNRLDYPLVDGLAEGRIKKWRYIKFWH